MSLIEIPICPAGDPTGTPVETLTEADISALRIEVSLNDLGEVRVTLPRNRWEALGLDMRESYYGRVKIPYIDNVGYIQGFWLLAGEMVLVDEDERGGEEITIGGPGPGWILSTAVLNHEEWTDHSGVYVQDGVWYWEGKNYGQILSDLVNEDAASNHPALDTMETPGWDNTNDVDGSPWPQFGGIFSQDVGTTFLDVIRALQRGGELEVWVNPNLNLRAYSGAYGRDLSGNSYGAGVVRFVGSSVTPDENRNIIGKLTREKDGAGELTHVLVLGNDRRLESGQIVEGSPIHKWVTSPDYLSGDKVHEGFLSYETNSRVILERAGQRYIQRTQDRSARMVDCEVMPGQDESNGLYLPGAPSSDRGNYWIGDTVTFKTGGAEGIDLFNRDLRIARIRMGLDVAASDASNQTRELSWRTFIETGDDATPSGSASSSLNDGRRGRGPTCRCLQLCAPVFAIEDTGVRDFQANDGGDDLLWTGVASNQGGAPGNGAEGSTYYYNLAGVVASSQTSYAAIPDGMYRIAGYYKRPLGGSRILAFNFYNVAAGTSDPALTPANIITNTDLFAGDPDPGSWTAFTQDITAPTGTLSMGMQHEGSGSLDFDEITVTLLGEAADPADYPEDIGDQGDEAPGTGNSAARCDHVHAHGLLSTSGTHHHDSADIEGGGGVSDLDDLSDVTLTTPATDDTLRFNGSVWVNDDRRWEAVTDGEDVFVWEGDDLVHEWKAY